MNSFTASIKKFSKKGEKTGWTYIEITSDIANQVFPENKKTFRVKGKLDSHSIKQVALMPMGNGSFILPLNIEMRKSLKKESGDELNVKLKPDLPESCSHPNSLNASKKNPQRSTISENFHLLTKNIIRTGY